MNEGRGASLVAKCRRLEKGKGKEVEGRGWVGAERRGRDESVNQGPKPLCSASKLCLPQYGVGKRSNPCTF